MKRVIVVVFIAIVGVALIFLWPVTSQSQTNRIIIEGADIVSDLSVSLTASLSLPSVGNVNRFVLENAEINRNIVLQYPDILLNDVTLPQATNFVSQGSGTKQTVHWTTNEAANSRLDYGLQSGIYTSSITNSLYSKVHSVTLTGLALNNSYYYKINSSDRSGNSYQSPEYLLVAGNSTYLPLIMR